MSVGKTDFSAPPTTTAVENADARIYGLESEIRWAVTPNVTLNAAANWLHARYTNFVSFDAARPGLGFFSLTPAPPPFSTGCG